MRLQRYCLTGWHENGDTRAIEDDNGEWCYASDVEELEAELRRYQEAHEARRLMRALEHVCREKALHRDWIDGTEVLLFVEAEHAAKAIVEQVP